MAEAKLLEKTIPAKDLAKADPLIFAKTCERHYKRMEHSHKDLYSVLKVARTASPEQIRSAYRELARAFHESANKDDALDASCEEKSAFTRTLRDATNAFNILSNPVRRAEYDSQLAPLVDGQTSIPGAHLNGNWPQGQRRGRSNETEFIAIKPTTPSPPFAKPAVAQAAPASPIAKAIAAEVKPQAPLKAAPLQEIKTPPLSTSAEKRLPPKLMAVIVVSSLSIGIVLAFFVKKALYGG